VCVVARKGLHLCSVMSAVPVPWKDCLENLDNFNYRDVLWGLRNWT